MVSGQASKQRSGLGAALRESRRALIGIGIFSAVINLLMLTGPLYMLQVYDRVLASKSMSTLVALSILMTGLYVFMGIMDFIRSRILVRLGSTLDESLSGPTFEGWIQQAIKETKTSRDRPLNDLGVIKSFFSGSAPVTIFDVPWAPFFILVIWILHWILGVAALCGAIILFFIALLNEFATRKRLDASRAHSINSRVYADESYRQAETLTAMGMTKNMRDRWFESRMKSAGFMISSSDKSGSYTASIKAFRMFLQSAILGLGCALAVMQIITPGAMIAASIITGRALAPIQSAIGQWKGFIQTREAYSRLDKFLGKIPNSKPVTALSKPEGHVIVRNVTAGPPESTMAVLKDVTFGLKPGQGLGIIGVSASGKSTLARLLAGIWMPQRGEVRLDGATFDQWDREYLGRHIGYLPQNVALMSGTIKENISRFDPEVEDDWVIKAAREAEIHEMILGFPDGYDTYVGNSGFNLSGGQVQRLALARALYGDPILIILDEPNANLDANGDTALTKAVATARNRGATVIIVTHRASAVAALDLVLVLEGGSVAHFGSKDRVFQVLRQKALNENLSQNKPKIQQGGQVTKKLFVTSIVEEGKDSE